MASCLIVSGKVYHGCQSTFKFSFLNFFDLNLRSGVPFFGGERESVVSVRVGGSFFPRSPDRRKERLIAGYFGLSVVIGI